MIVIMSGMNAEDKSVGECVVKVSGDTGCKVSPARCYGADRDWETTPNE